jgi:hypothetical protein
MAAMMATRVGALALSSRVVGLYLDFAVTGRKDCED